jgi:hypothetical protein
LKNRLQSEAKLTAIQYVISPTLTLVISPISSGASSLLYQTSGSTRSYHRISEVTPEYTVPGGRQRRQPPPPPPAEFPEPFATSISAQTSNFAYRLPGPQPGNNQRSEFSYISSPVPCILRSIKPRGFQYLVLAHTIPNQILLTSSPSTCPRPYGYLRTHALLSRSLLYVCLRTLRPHPHANSHLYTKMRPIHTHPHPNLCRDLAPIIRRFLSH